MIDLAKYARIYDPSPDDGRITKGQAAIKESVAQLKKISPSNELVAIGAATANAFSRGVVDDPVGSTVATALKKQSPAFVREEGQKEVLVCSAVVVMEMLSGNDGNSPVARNDLIAAAVWSALGYQSPSKDVRLEQLRQDLLNTSRLWCERRSEQSRQRVAPGDVPEATEGDASQVIKSLAAASKAVGNLRSNAVLDREEIDILWWAMGTRSPTLNRPYNSLSPTQCAVVCGMELGSQLRRLPADAHRQLALNRTAELPEFNLAGILGELKDVREALIEEMPGVSIVESNPDVFPLLGAIYSGTAPKRGPVLAGNVWCARALLETSLAALCETPSAKV